MRRGSVVLTVLLALARPVWAGSTRCWIDQGAVVTAAAFGDIAGDFIVDVGTPASELHVTAANLDGITEQSAERPLVFAGRRLAAVRLRVVDLDGAPPTDTNIAGVLGADVLLRRPLTISFSPCRVTWNSKPLPRGALKLPLQIADGVPTVGARLSDGSTARADQMVVATGRAESLIAGAALTRAWKFGSFQPVRLRAVEIGGRLLEQVPADVAEHGPGSLGSGVWRHWKSMRLDAQRGWLQLR